MKKLISFLAIGLFLALPLTASAAFLGSGQLDVKWSTPTSGGSPNYYTDYDGKVAGVSTDWEEIFCVSEDHANPIEIVDFYTITPDLDATFGTGFYARLAQAAWIADNWTTYLTSSVSLDVLKGEAQKAVWEVADVVSRAGTSGIDADIWADALGHTDYLTDNWFYAHSPGAGTIPNYQDYLTPTAPVPEPATMFLFGAGLIGLAGIGRKKFNK